MNYFDVYKSRLKSYGNNSEETYINATKQVINKSFDDSLFSATILIDGIETDVIINQGKTSEDRNILLRPDHLINRGAIAVIEGLNYLIIDFDKNKLYPIAKGKLCNSTYTLTSQSTQTIVGYDYRGAPIYETVEGETTEIPCITENQVYMGDSNQPINLPDGRLKVTLPYMEHEQLVVGQSFTMYGESYTIQNVDKTKSINGVGLLVITGERST